MAKILLHTLVFSPDGVSTAYLMTDLARQLERLGHQVSVLTTTPHYNVLQASLERQPMTPVWKGLLYKSECDGVDVWHVAIAKKGEKVAGRSLDYLRFHLVSLLAAFFGKVGEYDIVIAPSPPLSIGAIAWLLARRKRTPCVYNVQEIYPDFAINQGLLRNKTVIKLMKRLESFVYAKSDAIVPISEWFRRIIAQRSVPPEKLIVIPNFVDTELYRPLPRDNAFAREHGLLNDFVVLYGGNIGLSQDWESLLFAAEQLADLPILFVIAGDGVQREWLQTEIHKRQLTNVRLLGYQPRELMPEINASCDVATIPMHAMSTTDTFPSKIYTIMACAKPCIVTADDDSELAWIIRQSGSGAWVPPDDAQAYTDAIRHAFLTRQSLAAEGARGRAFVEQEYSKEAVAQRYDRLINHLIDNHRQAVTPIQQ